MKWTTMSLLMASTLPVMGAVIQVPEDQPSIQSAINIASNGDNISVASGTWNEWLHFRGKSITVEGRDGALKTIIDGGDAPTAVRFSNGETRKSILQGFTITSNGSGVLHEGLLLGAGIYIHQASPTIKHCIIRNCQSQMGGGISVWNGNPRFESCHLIENQATLNGGGMLFHQNSQPELFACEFIGNHAAIHGGGLAYGNDSDGLHENCVFTGNSAGIRGGGLSKSCDCSNANITGTSMCHNSPDHILGTWNDLGGNDLCPVCSHDVTADGSVGVDDVLAVVSAWGGCVCVEDINGDSVVNVDDLLLVIGDFGPCPTTP